MSITHATVAAGTDAGTGEIHKAEWNAAHVISGFNAAFIGVAAYKAADLAMSTSGEAALTMDSELFDTDGFHDTSTNSERFTVPAGLGGKYLVGFNGRTDNNFNAYIVARKQTANTVLLLENQLWNSNNSFGSIVGSTTVDLAAGDYVEFKQLANGGTNLKASSGPQAWAWMYKLDSGKVGSGIGAKAYNSAAQSINDDTGTALTFDSEEFDTDGFHSTSSNTSRVTIPAGLGGKYLLTASAYFSGFDADGTRLMWFKKNGSDLRGESRIGPASNSGQTPNPHIIVDLAAGDYVEVFVYQNSGAAMNVGHASSLSAQATFAIMRLDSGGSDPTFSDWTPVLTAVTTNPTLGSGSEAYGRYTQHGKLVVARGHIKFGTSGTNAGSGAYRISLPVPAASPAGSVGVYGHGYLYDDSAGTLKQHTLGFVTTTTMQFVIDGTAGSTSPVDNTVPWAWGASDYLLFSMEYEAA